MLLLTATNHSLRVVTGASGADVLVHADWLENDGGSVTPDAQNTPSITTATTTIVVPSPAAGKQRAITGVQATNNHATTSTQVTVEHFDGSIASPLMGVTLLPGENLMFSESGEWKHHDAQGAEYTYTPPAPLNLGPTGTLAETVPRELLQEGSNAWPQFSGTLGMVAIWLTAGQLISNLTMGNTHFVAAASPTHYIFGLYDLNLLLCAQTADQLTTPWAANEVKTIPLITPYRVPVSGMYFIGFFMVATTIVRIQGVPQLSGSLAPHNVFASPRCLSYGNNTALTTALPNPAPEYDEINNPMVIPYFALS